MKKFLSISFLTFKEATRDKFFLGVVFFLLFYLFFCTFLGKLSVGHAEKVMRDAGLLGIELTSVILIIFSFTLSFFRERESRILEVYLSHCKPLTYLSGKIFGYILLSLFYLGFSGVGFALVLGWYGAFHYSVLLAIYPLFLKTVIIICFTSLFSVLFSSATMTLLSLLFLYWAAELIPTALAIVRAYAQGLQHTFVQILYFILPNMDKLDIGAFALYGKSPSLGYFFWVSVYTLIYCFVLWLISLFVFQKREH